MISLLRIVRIIKDIYSVDDWFRLAPPAGGVKHWVDDKSAKELAKAWCGGSSGPAVPVQLQELLSTHSDIDGAVIFEATPERKVRFDDIPGEPRNADLVCLAERAGKLIAISIEAKADETFGDLVAKVLKTPKPSRRPERVEKLCLALFGRQPDELPGFGQLRYQLLHGVGAAIAYAGEVKASCALFVVHEFVRPDTKTEQNEYDLNRFLNLLAPEAVPLGERLYGPVRVPGNQHIPGNIPLYLGKIRAEI
jgi:hypothetical protein